MTTDRIDDLIFETAASGIDQLHRDPGCFAELIQGGSNSEIARKQSVYVSSQFELSSAYDPVCTGVNTVGLSLSKRGQCPRSDRRPHGPGR
jgi:hypothetical protein